MNYLSESESESSDSFLLIMTTRCHIHTNKACHWPLTLQTQTLNLAYSSNNCRRLRMKHVL